MLCLVAEGMVRELLGPGRILGNHVVLDLGGGVFAALAHLRRGSLLVRRGDRVAAGQQLAECGNSGNSTEPHLHFQLMDHPSVLQAAGLPLRFTAPGQGEAPGRADLRKVGPVGEGTLEQAALSPAGRRRPGVRRRSAGRRRVGCR